MSRATPFDEMTPSEQQRDIDHRSDPFEQGWDEDAWEEYLADGAAEARAEARAEAWLDRWAE